MSKVINTVDLFSGCGGLSLGFKLYAGHIEYKVTMALDNDLSAIKCFNHNSPPPSDTINTARLCDLTWFSHPSEVLLYYLVHLALWEPNNQLLRQLEELGLIAFFNDVRRIDQRYNEAVDLLISTEQYQQDFDIIEPKTFTLAIVKAFFGRLGIESLRNAALSLVNLAWAEEYKCTQQMEKSETSLDNSKVIDAIGKSVEEDWTKQLTNLEEASKKKGRGQHKVVSVRLQSLVKFLNSESGTKLKKIWAEWKTERDSIRANFCITNQDSFTSLYTPERQVHLILGGPPCKGFSRIGRAVVERLREQGVHSWTSMEYGDERNALLHKYVLFLEALKPNVFVFENVAHFQSALRTPNGTLDAAGVLAQSIRELSGSKLNFDVKSRIVRTRQFGVPQHRERFIMVGFNSGLNGGTAASKFFDFPIYKDQVPLKYALIGLDDPVEFDYRNSNSPESGHLSNAYTLIDPNMPTPIVRYLEWIRQPALGKDQAPEKVDAHVVRVPRVDDLALIKKWAPGQRWMDYEIKHSPTLNQLKILLTRLLKYQKENQSDELPEVNEIEDLLSKADKSILIRLIIENVKLPLDFEGEHHLLKPGYLSKGTDSHGDWFERLSANKPCKTIVAHIGKDTYGYIHPYEHRAISMREAARIQSFPDFFRFSSAGIVVGYSMIGNAVPPLIANLFAKRLAELDHSLQIFNPPKDTVKPSRNVSDPKQIEMGLEPEISSK